jgi:hypothetical protein
VAAATEVAPGLQSSPTAARAAAVRPRQAETTGLGWLPALTLVMSVGLLLVTLADNASRAGEGWAEPVFWIGLGVVVVPVLGRLVGADASNHERLGLVLASGIALYVLKILHSPVAFTFPDEYVQVHIAQQTVDNHRLFQPNPIVPVASLYSGLASAASALITLSGLSDFAAGLLLIGVARVVLLLAMFLLLADVSGSSRLAGIATAIYTANPNFLFYSAEFGYEPLALSLAAVTVYAVLRRLAHTRSERLAWTLVAFLPLQGGVVTHHLTAYVLVFLLGVVCLLCVWYVKQPWLAPWDLTVSGVVGILAWLSLLASPTLVYLGNILGGVLAGAVRLVITHQLGRQLFQTASGGSVAPLWHQVLAFAAALLIMLALPFGLWQVWQHYRRNLFAVVLAAAALAYPPLQLLRFTDVGWETATRSSEFLFVGVGFVVALMFVTFRPSVRGRNLGLVGPVLTVWAAVIFAGGVAGGWQADLLLPRAYLVSAGGPPVEPEGVTDARWTLAALGAGNVFAADPSTAAQLLTYGDQFPLTGEARGIRSALFITRMDPSVPEIFRAAQVQFVAVDRRLISGTPLVGIYPPRPGVDPDQDVLMDRRAIAKFDQQPGVLRILDSGNIVMFDIGVLSAPASQD